MSITDKRLGRTARVLFKAPVIMYRLRLGWLFGRRLLLLAHRGRRSGRMHRTVLEVVSFDRSEREAIVISGWGERADWYRNIEASPAVEIEVGFHRYPAPRQRFLTTEDVYELLKRYCRRHPLAARFFGGFMGWPFGGSEEEWRRCARTTRAVAFRPTKSV